MRITGGSARGQVLQAPRQKSTRPTSDRVREALFGLLEALPTRWESVLDLYAGSGALGIEALSRGAGRVDFVESQRAACAVIQANLARLGLGDRARVICRPVERALPALDRRYDIILADPPYADPNRDNLLDQLARSGLLTGEGFVVVDHSLHYPVADSYERLRLATQRPYGETVISIFSAEEQP